MVHVADCAVSLGFLLQFARNDVPDGFSTADVVQRIVKPATSSQRCRYVSLASVPPSAVGRSQFFVSHRWGADFTRELVALVANHFVEAADASDATEAARRLAMPADVHSCTTNKSPEPYSLRLDQGVELLTAGTCPSPFRTDMPTRTSFESLTAPCRASIPAPAAPPASSNSRMPSSSISGGMNSPLASPVPPVPRLLFPSGSTSMLPMSHASSSPRVPSRPPSLRPSAPRPRVSKDFSDPSSMVAPSGHSNSSIRSGNSITSRALGGVSKKYTDRTRNSGSSRTVLPNTAASGGREYGGIGGDGGGGNGLQHCPSLPGTATIAAPIAPAVATGAGAAASSSAADRDLLEYSSVEFLDLGSFSGAAFSSLQSQPTGHRKLLPSQQAQPQQPQPQPSLPMPPPQQQQHSSSHQQQRQSLQLPVPLPLPATAAAAAVAALGGGSSQRQRFLACSSNPPQRRSSLGRISTGGSGRTSIAAGTKMATAPAYAPAPPPAAPPLAAAPLTPRGTGAVYGSMATSSGGGAAAADGEALTSAGGADGAVPRLASSSTAATASVCASAFTGRSSGGGRSSSCSGGGLSTSGGGGGGGNYLAYGSLAAAAAEPPLPASVAPPPSAAPFASSASTATTAATSPGAAAAATATSASSSNAELVDGLLARFKGRERLLRETFVWLDVFAINQHPDSTQADDLSRLQEVVGGCQATLLVLDPGGLVLTRIWCLYEIWQTVRQRGPQSLQVLCGRLHHSQLGRVWGDMDVERAQATVEADRVRILADIRSDTGLQPLNQAIKKAIVESACRDLSTARAARAAASAAFPGASSTCPTSLAPASFSPAPASVASATASAFSPASASCPAVSCPVAPSALRAAHLLRLAGRPHEALAAAREAAEGFRDAAAAAGGGGAGHADTLQALRTVAACHADLGALPLAAQLLQQQVVPYLDAAEAAAQDSAKATALTATPVCTTAFDLLPYDALSDLGVLQYKLGQYDLSYNTLLRSLYHQLRELHAAAPNVTPQLLGVVVLPCMGATTPSAPATAAAAPATANVGASGAVAAAAATDEGEAAVEEALIRYTGSGGGGCTAAASLAVAAAPPPRSLSEEQLTAALAAVRSLAAAVAAEAEREREREGGEAAGGAGCGGAQGGVGGGGGGCMGRLRGSVEGVGERVGLTLTSLGLVQWERSRHVRGSSSSGGAGGGGGGTAAGYSTICGGGGGGGGNSGGGFGAPESGSGLVRRARQLLEAAVELLDSLSSSEGGLSALDARGHLAMMVMEAGEMQSCESLLRSTLSLTRRVYGSAHPHSATAMNNLALCLKRTRRPSARSEAASLYRRCLELCGSQLGEQHPDTLAVAVNLGVLLADLRQWSESEALLTRAVACCSSMLPVTSNGYNGNGYNGCNGYNGSSSSSPAPPWPHPDVLAAHRRLAEVLECRNKLFESEALWRLTQQLAEGCPPEARDHELLLECGEALQRLQGRMEAAVRAQAGGGCCVIS